MQEKAAAAMAMLVISFAPIFAHLENERNKTKF
jgi:hypothetical protein